MNDFTIRRPITKADKPPKTDVIIYVAACKYFSVSIMPIASIENAENVVKPPNIPTIKNSDMPCDTDVLREKNDSMAPIRKHPIILAVKTPYVPNSDDRPNRATAPIAPPMATGMM